MKLIFFSEIIETLGLESYSIDGTFKSAEITVDNVFSHIKQKRFLRFFDKLFRTEIEFISSHFFELCQSHFEDLISLSIEILALIFENEKLQMKSIEIIVFIFHLKFFVFEKITSFIG